MNKNPLGYNPMRWNCEKRGCYNVKHRPKIEIFADVWPGRISMGDVDGIVEIEGNALMLEWKTDTTKITTGQRIMYQRITNRQQVTVFCVCGNAETMEITAYKIFFDGRENPRDTWTPISLDIFKQKLKHWCEWAQKHPKKDRDPHGKGDS